MTAGAGVVHAEMPSSAIQREGGRFSLLVSGHDDETGEVTVVSVKNVFEIDLSAASDVQGIALPATGNLPAGVAAVAKSAKLMDLDANTLAALGGRSPEKWEGLAVGPQLQDGSYLLLAGTDNDYSVTQNGSNQQFDIYYNPSTGTRMQCDLGATSNCFSVSNGGSVGDTNLGDLPAGFALIPGVLQAYKASATDLGGYTAPVPEPGTWAMMLGGLAVLGCAARARRQAA